MNKKGISPLIATVLILGFTVALASAIMFWGQNLTDNIQEDYCGCDTYEMDIKGHTTYLTIYENGTISTKGGIIKNCEFDGDNLTCTYNLKIEG